MEKLHIFRLEHFNPQLVGTIAADGLSFQYNAGYLAFENALPLSASLPLRSQPFSEVEFRPYFEGLIAEGPARAALAGELAVKDSDYLALLEACGKDCIGDIVVSREQRIDAKGSYTPISNSELLDIFADEPHLFENNAASRLSLAGTQSKTGLAHEPGAPIREGWLKPDGFAATTHILKISHIRDIPENEFLCMKAAAACGIDTAKVTLLDLRRPVLAVERFDRDVRCSTGTPLSVKRKHQEDFAQAFGINPPSKYSEMSGGTISAIARFLRLNSARPAYDVASFARMLCFSYAIGDCDAHLKNFSLLSSNNGNGQYHVRLSPAYDFVSTTAFPRFSRDLAADFGGMRCIDDVRAEHLAALAEDLGITVRALKSIAKPVADRVLGAIAQAGNGEFGEVLDSTPYIADELVEECAPRVEVLRGFCEG